jgi:hypothetical protein
MSFSVIISGRRRSAPPVDAERRLQLARTVELVEHHVGHRIARISITTRMPCRSDSSRMSEMPSMRLSRTSSAIFSIIEALFTW